MALARINWTTEVTEYHEVTLDLETLPKRMSESFVRFSLPADGKSRVDEGIDIETVITEHETHDITEVSADVTERTITKVVIVR